MTSIFQPYDVGLRTKQTTGVASFVAYYTVFNTQTKETIIDEIPFPTQAQEIAQAMNDAYWQGQHDMAASVKMLVCPQIDQLINQTIDTGELAK